MHKCPCINVETEPRMLWWGKLNQRKICKIESTENLDQPLCTLSTERSSLWMFTHKCFKHRNLNVETKPRTMWCGDRETEPTEASHSVKGSSLFRDNFFCWTYFALIQFWLIWQNDLFTENLECYTKCLHWSCGYGFMTSSKGIHPCLYGINTSIAYSIFCITNSGKISSAIKLPLAGTAPGTFCDPLWYLPAWANLASVSWGMFSFAFVFAPKKGTRVVLKRCQVQSLLEVNVLLNFFPPNTSL